MWEVVYKSQIAGHIAAKVEEAYEELVVREDLGFMKSELIDQALKSTHEVVGKIGNVKKIAVVGIGGSSLGAQALCGGLFPHLWRERITFFDNVDACTLELQLGTIKDPEEYTWIVISKSGSTIEALTVYDFCHQYFKVRDRMDIRLNTVVITEYKSSPLYDFAKDHNITTLEIPRSVGGRYSVFTPVGLLPLALMGADVDAIVAGAKEGLGNQELIIHMASELVSSLTRSEFNFYVFCYSDRMPIWGSWLQQLWAESLAKHLDREGDLAPLMSTMIPCRGATDQHSILQQMAEGRDKKFVCFVRDEAAEKGNLVLETSNFSNEIMVGKNMGQLLAAEVHATADALLEKNVQSVMLKTSQVDEESMAHLMGVWMMVVGTLGEVYNINAYDQPGVESGKILARRVLGGTV